MLYRSHQTGHLSASWTPSRRLATVVFAVPVLLLSMLTLSSSPAPADTAPEQPVTLTTVSADSLPTVQINGVVWDQVIVGNTVYATGEFTSARPAGSPAGTNETPRSNILAYNLTTGELITSWAPSLNAQGRSIVASADGKRIFVGGSFTSVSGVNRYRVVALDATTGAVIPSWNVVADARVRSLAISGDTLYLGGIFATVGGQPRTRLAAVSATSGAVLAWAPTADAEVLDLVAPADSGKVVAAGKFTVLNGAANYGMGALDATTGAVLPWAIGATVRNAGDNAAIYSLSTDGAQVYGTGYTYGSGGNFEGTFAAKSADGSIVYVNGCLGDTYDSAPVGGVLYDVSHAHNCSSVGANPEVSPRAWQRAAAQSTTRAASGLVNSGGNFNGQPAAEVLHWLPTLEPGTYTGQDQAAWNVKATSDYVVLGGEFTKVNSTAQQGLVRFAVSSIAPNKQGPQGGSELTPTITGTAPGTVRVSWKSAWDRDNRRLTYQVLRGPSLASSVSVATLTQDATWWSRPTLSFTDYTSPGGTQSYRIQVKDAFGNVVNSDPASGTVPAGALSSTAYPDAVRADAPSAYWRLGEATGAPGYDWAGNNDLTLASTTTRAVPGALVNDSDAAVSFPGSGALPAVAGQQVAAPQVFTEEAWFKTTSTSGGKIIGFGNSKTGASGTADRHVYLTNNGRLAFGVISGSAQVLTSTGTYNDGQWHHVVATMDSAGMRLYADGALLGSNAISSAQTYNGYWRIDGDTISTSWPNRPTSTALAGSIDDVAVYPSALSASAVQTHYQAGLWTAINRPPTASFDSSVLGRTVSVDATASTDPDGTIASSAWDFGDGTSGTGTTATHTYAADGTYQVKLTVTDNDGATATTTKPVTVAGSSTGAALATDTFERTVASGWGTAEVGGAWTLSATGSTLSVTAGSGQASVPAGRTVTAKLNAVQNLATDLTTQVWSDAAPTGGGTYVSAIVRSSSGGDYRTRLKLLATGVVQASITSVVGSTETALTSTVAVSGITYSAGDKLLVRSQATGSSPTTVRYRVWRQGTTEPDTWLQTVTDSTAGLQAAGAVGLIAYVSSSATQAAVLHFDNLSAVQL